MMHVFFRILPAALTIVWLQLAGCSPSAPTPPTTAKPKVPVLDLKFEAKAGRLNKNETLVELRDTSGQGAKVVGVSRIAIDKITDSDDKPLDARLKSFQWRKTAAEAGSSEEAGDVFQLLLILSGTVSDPIGTLNGTFETQWGIETLVHITLTELQTESVTSPELAAASITADVQKIKKQLTVVLSGRDDQLLGAYFYDGETVLAQAKSFTPKSGPDIRISASITDPPASTELRVRIGKEVQKNSQAFRLQNIKMEQ